VHAANQVVDTTKSPTTFIDTTANGVDLIKGEGLFKGTHKYYFRLVF
jgi:hypothetical protein